MANWSDTSVTLVAQDVMDFVALTRELKSDIKDNYLSADGYTGSMNIEYFEYDIDDLIIEIQGEGRWSAPMDYFISMAIKYKLNMDYVDAEPGNSFFIKVETINGEVTCNIEEDYISQASIDEFGVNYFEYQLNYLAETYEASPEDWEECHKEDIELFMSNGLTIDELKGIPEDV